MLPNTSHERNLLFAGLGLQLTLLNKEQMVRGFRETALNKTLSLGEILVQQKAITPEQQKAIEGAVETQIQNDGGEVQALASVKNPQEIETCLKVIEDHGLAMTLCTMNALQSRKIVGNDLTFPPELHQPLPDKKRLDQRFHRKHFLDAGNLGEIWFAKDEELNRTVVLKYIKAEQEGNSFTKALFNLEGEVTGYLEHPAVVPVYSMGQDDKARSFYAMRYIQGRKLTRAIADYHALPTPSIGKRREALTELLQSFQTACLAIEYAHSKGILHCDLKPDNIVVGPFGETLVIDWGLAMVTASTAELAQEAKNLENIPPAQASGTIAGPYSPSKSSRPGLHSSQGGMRKFVGGTPAYMAPEQMRATRGGEVKEVNHSSDIFGLGAILYHLLTSRAPYFPNKEKHEVYVEFIQRIEKGVFPQPRQLDSSIPKVLEAIVLKSMAASPADRYGSARDLAEEVKRWLADEPVRAYRENAWERSRRWARNHRTAMAAGVMLLFCLALGGLGFGLQTKRYNEKLQMSEKAALKREAMAISAVKQYADTVKDNPELKNRPELEPLRKELLKDAVRFFKELSDQLRSEKNLSPKTLSDLAEGLFNLAYLTAEIGNKADAIAFYQEATMIWGNLGQANSLGEKFQNNLALPNNILNNLDRIMSRFKEGEEGLKKVLAVLETVAKGNPENEEFQNNLALGYLNLAIYYNSLNRLKEAEGSYLNALVIQDKLMKVNATNSKFQADLAKTKMHFAGLRKAQAWSLVFMEGKGKDGYQKGFLLAQEALTLSPQNSELLNTLGVAQYRVKQFPAALETLQKSNALNSKVRAKEGPGDLAFLVMTCHQLNKKVEAESYFKKLQEAMKDKKNSENKEYQGFFKEAEALLKE